MEEQRLQEAGITQAQWVTMLAFSKLAMFEEGGIEEPALSEDELLHLAKYTKKEVYSQRGCRLVCDWSALGSNTMWEAASPLLREQLAPLYKGAKKSISYGHTVIFAKPAETPVSGEDAASLEELVEVVFQKHGKIVHKHELAIHCGLESPSQYKEILQLLLDPVLSQEELNSIAELASVRAKTCVEMERVAPIVFKKTKKSSKRKPDYDSYELT